MRTLVWKLNAISVDSHVFAITEALISLWRELANITRIFTTGRYWKWLRCFDKTGDTILFSLQRYNKQYSGIYCFVLPSSTSVRTTSVSQLHRRRLSSWGRQPAYGPLTFIIETILRVHVDEATIRSRKTRELQTKKKNDFFGYYIVVRVNNDLTYCKIK